MKKKIKLVWIAAFVVSFLTLADSLAIKAESVSRIIANVNGEIITSKDLDDYCNFLKYKNPEIEINEEFKKNLLQRLIEDKLIISQARKEKIEVPSSWIKDRMQAFISSYPSYEAFEASLIKEGLTITALKEKLKAEYLTQKIIDKYVRSKISISPQEITDFYNNNKEIFREPKKYIIWMAKIDSEEKAEELNNKIKSEGIDSLDKKSYRLVKLEVEEKSLKEEIKTIVATLKEGETKIQKSSDFYYLIYLEKVVPSKITPLEKAKEKIHSYLWEKKFREEFTRWTNNLKKEALIKVYD
ncbi:MAG: SurA N-terminal domain-containing protein [Candidatus Omnitrophica bacterium]|nr:SurA N-terminal domain-containing protein [Candidatus Omnitrophota bacterium]